MRSHFPWTGPSGYDGWEKKRHEHIGQLVQGKGCPLVFWDENEKILVINKLPKWDETGVYPWKIFKVSSKDESSPSNYHVSGAFLR